MFLLLRYPFGVRHRAEICSVKFMMVDLFRTNLVPSQHPIQLSPYERDGNDETVATSVPEQDVDYVKSHSVGTKDFVGRVSSK